jgi:hypothetical protein
MSNESQLLVAPGGAEVGAPPVVTVADVLVRAADLLEEHGWVQGRIGALGEGFCAVGATEQAARDLGVPSSTNAVVGLTYFVGTPFDAEVENLAMRFLNGAWNDRPGRTKAEVVARLRDAARGGAA